MAAMVGAGSTTIKRQLWCSLWPKAPVPVSAKNVASWDHPDRSLNQGLGLDRCPSIDPFEWEWRAHCDRTKDSNRCEAALQAPMVVSGWLLPFGPERANDGSCLRPLAS
jgi:hypothetical protein